MAENIREKKILEKGRVFEKEIKEPEVAPSPEKRKEAIGFEKIEEGRSRLSRPVAQKKRDDQKKPFVPQIVKSPIRKEIEAIMQDDLADAFASLDAQEKVVFRQKGEEVASKIEVLVETLKVKARNILKLIKEWLMMIPGINKFFLEQESKLKTDRLMELSMKRKKELKLKNKNKI